jgi:hypothetical protein
MLEHMAQPGAVVLEDSALESAGVTIGAAVFEETG